MIPRARCSTSLVLRSPREMGAPHQRRTWEYKDVRKSPIGGKAGSGSDGCVGGDGCVGVREDAVLERTDSTLSHVYVLLMWSTVQRYIQGSKKKSSPYARVEQAPTRR